MAHIGDAQEMVTHSINNLSRSSTWWQTSKGGGESHQSYVPLDIEGEFEVNAERVTAQEKPGLPLFSSRIKLLRGEVIPDYLTDVHHAQAMSHTGPTATTCSLVALGVGLASMGTLGPAVAGAMGAAEGGIAAAAISAGASCVASQYAVSMASTRGDVGASAKALTKREALRNVAVAMATAGLGHEFLGAAHVSTTPDSFSGFIAKSGLESLAHTVATVVINGESFEDAFIQGLRTAAITAATSYLAYNTGLLYEDKHIGYAAHKGLHGAIAFGGARAFGLSTEHAGLIGLSTALAEATVEGLIGTREAGTGMRSDGTDARTPGVEEHIVITNPSTGQITHTSVPTGLGTARNIAHFVGAAVGGVLTGNVGVASVMAANAIDNNAMATERRKALGPIQTGFTEEERERLDATKLSTPTTQAADATAYGSRRKVVYKHAGAVLGAPTGTTGRRAADVLTTQASMSREQYVEWRMVETVDALGRPLTFAEQLDYKAKFETRHASIQATAPYMQQEYYDGVFSWMGRGAEWAFEQVGEGIKAAVDAVEYPLRRIGMIDPVSLKLTRYAIEDLAMLYAPSRALVRSSARGLSSISTRTAVAETMRVAPEVMLWDISTSKAVGSAAESAGLDAAVIRAPLPRQRSKVIQHDYTTEYAPYSLRIDPITGRGPMSVDASKFTSATSYTAKGAPRNRDQFWKMWSEKYPETLSARNIGEIRLRLTPIVDEVWLNHFPEHHLFKGETLIHHHIDYGFPVYPLPLGLHGRVPGHKIFHNK